jgi:nucleotide-binding universal stress UspA family protein
MPIVCGTDFSTNTAVAVDAASAIAKKLNEPLQLLHVVLSAKGLSADDPRQQQLTRASEALRAKGVTVQEEMCTGQPEEQLTTKAQKSRMLVVGAFGHQNVASGQIGNVAAKTTQLCQAPVLVVRSALPFIEWTSGQRPLKIILAADASPPAKVAAQWLSGLKAAGAIDVVAVNLYDVQTELTRLGIPGVTDFVTPHPEAEKVLQREMLERCQPLEDADRLTLRVEPKKSDIAEQILQIAAQENADLIVVGAHQRRGLSQLWYRSISQAILQQANIAVASVPMVYTEQKSAKNQPKLPRVQRVLVPTEISETGSIALPYAYSTAGANGVVHMIHIVKAPPDSEVKDRNTLESKMRGMIPQQAKEMNIVTEIEIVNSVETAEAICQAAERLGVDVICMASHGHSGIMQRVMGATAQEVLESSKKPLLVIR